ncbi:MAG: ATPase [Lachnospiraceae bacterium]|nr:ATPase [Lachnospiraceae bacterium]
MAKKITEYLDELENYIDSCKPAAFSKTNIIVDRDVFEDKVADIREHLPEEMRTYQKIVSNQEAIIEDAKARAEALMEKARAYTDKMINEHTIMQEAYAQAGVIVNEAHLQAQEIVDAAQEQANMIQLGAIKYMDNSLASIQDILNSTIHEVQSRDEALISNLQDLLDTVNNNRQELDSENEDVPGIGPGGIDDSMMNPRAQEPAAAAPAAPSAPVEDTEDDSYDDIPLGDISIDDTDLDALNGLN